MNILIVEDDPFVLTDIIDKLELIGYKHIHTAKNYKSALEKIELFDIQIVLLDIDLGEEKNGIDVGKILNEKQISFIYLSDIQDSVTFEEAKKTQPSANLNKPVSPIQLRNSISLALSNPNKKETTENKYIVVSKGSIKIRINPKDIVFLKAANNNCEIHFATGDNKKLISSTPMGNVLQVLNLEKFCQVHRSYAVNLNKVHSYQGNRIYIASDQKTEIPISPSYLTNFKDRFEAI